MEDKNDATRDEYELVLQIDQVTEHFQYPVQSDVYPQVISLVYETICSSHYMRGVQQVFWEINI